MKKLAVIAISFATTLMSILPAQAFPSVVQPRAPQANDIQQVQYWDRGRPWRGGPHYDDRYRYRRSNGNAGAIIGGLALGAIVGGALAQPRYVEPRRYIAPRYAPRYVGGNAHVQYCYSRYRSYRSYDNTFQPYYGPRQQCYSPY